MSGVVYSYSNIIDLTEILTETTFKKKYNVVFIAGSDNKADLGKQLVYFKDFVKRDLRKKNNDNEPKGAGK